MHRLGSALRLLAAVALASCAGAPATPEGPPPAIEVEPFGGEKLRLVTVGFEPEVAVEGIAAADAPLGRAVLVATLDGLPPGKGPEPGQVLELRFGGATARVQLVSAAGNALLVIDVPPSGSTVPPVKAMATAAWARAEEARDRGDETTARQMALQSVRLFPGDPLAEVRPEAPGENRQNHLAWALLARLTDGPESTRWYVGALERSPRYLAAELGASPAALLEIPHGELEAAASRIVRENLAAARSRGSGPVVEILSPIWTEPRQLALLTAGHLTLYFTPPGSDLLQQERILRLAVEAFERLRSDPVELLLATREIRSLYLDEPLLAQPPREARPWEKMLSALIADVARKGAAGLSEAEIEATLSPAASHEDLAAARAKLRQQREREASWYRLALEAEGR